MFYIYNPRSAFRRIARDLQIPVEYPHHHRRVGIHRRNVFNDSIAINIGCSCYTAINGQTVLNADVHTALSKIKTFHALHDAGIRCPRVLTEEDARASDARVLGRTDRLSGGLGIIIYENGSEIPRDHQHDFFVRVVQCRREFRIHVWRGDVLAIQKKRLSNASSIIHNHDNGVLFQYIPTDAFNIGDQRTAQVKEMSIAAVQAVGIDFGAVDVLQEQGTNKLYILEVNTAPGITSEPIYNAYKNVIATLVRVSL